MTMCLFNQEKLDCDLLQSNCRSTCAVLLEYFMYIGMCCEEDFFIRQIHNYTEYNQ